VVEVELARRRSDLPAAQEAVRGLEAVLADEHPVAPEYQALALMNLGIAELWAGRPGEARLHLEDALSRTRRISRPFIEVGCLAHLAVAAPVTGQPLPLALELSERALAIAEEHGWTSQSMTTGAFVMAGMALERMGRFADAERHLDRAEEALRAGADPGTEVLLHHARGVLRFGEGRFQEALGELARAQRLERLLAGSHVLLVDVRSRAEWDWVGRIPEAIMIEWNSWPSGERNPAFVDELKARVPKTTAPTLFICRSGARSHSAAAAAALSGYTNAFNVLEGFEGDKNEQGRRNTVGGWRAAGLPWEQS